MKATVKKISSVVSKKNRQNPGIHIGFYGEVQVCLKNVNKYRFLSLTKYSDEFSYT